MHNVRPVGSKLDKDDFRLAAAIQRMPKWVWPKGYDSKAASMHFVMVQAGPKFTR